MLPRVLEPEVMDSAEEARDYDAMDHSQVNRLFVTDFLSLWGDQGGLVLDVGTGTAQIPIELCRENSHVQVTAIDMAEHMLRLGQENVRRAGFSDRLRLEWCDAKQMPFPDNYYSAVISNSIVHHIPEPRAVFGEMVRVVLPGGLLFVRDLLRPESAEQVRHLVANYAGDANPHQQQMFADSLRAGLTLEEVRSIIMVHGFEPDTVQQNSDRHWTWRAWKSKK